MSALVEALKQKVIEPYNRVTSELVTGQIMDYDSKTNLATVFYDDPKNGGIVAAELVPVQLPGTGVVASGPFPGDQVWLQFANGNFLKPKVVAIADEAYAVSSRSKTQHDDEGAFLTDYVTDAKNLTLFSVIDYRSRASQSSNTSRLQDAWSSGGGLDQISNKSYQKFSTDEFTEDVKESAYYRTAELGMTHPSNSSTVKIRDNGIIDLFASSNCGARIDPNSRMVSLTGNHVTVHSTLSTLLIDKTLKLEAGKGISFKTKAYESFCEKGWLSATNWYQSIEVLTYDGTTSVITLQDLTLSTQRANLFIDELDYEGSHLSLTLKTYEALTEEWSLNTQQQFLTASKGTVNIGHYQLTSEHSELAIATLDLISKTIDVKSDDYQLKTLNYQINSTNYTDQSEQRTIKTKECSFHSTNASLTVQERLALQLKNCLVTSADYHHQTNNYVFNATDWTSTVSNYSLTTIDYDLNTTNYRLNTTNYTLETSLYELEVDNYNLSAHQNISLNSTQNTTIHADQLMTFSAVRDMSVASNQNLTLSADQMVTIEGTGEVIIKGASKVTIQSDTLIDVTTPRFQIAGDTISLDGYIEANLDHLIEDYLERHFERFFDREVIRKQVVKRPTVIPVHKGE